MPLSKLKNIRIDFSLFDENSKPQAQLPIFIQYYEVTQNEWISIYVATIEKGVLSIEETTKSRAKALLSFFTILKDNEIPELRIIAQKNLYNLEKFQVLTSLYAFSFDEEMSILHFDFGTAYLLSEELLKQQKGFKDFIVVTSPYSFANQNQVLDTALKQCVANKKELEESLAASKNQLKEKQDQYTDISNKFKDITEQNKKISKEYTALQDNFDSLKKEANDCQNEKEKLNASLIKEQNKNEELNKNTIDLNKKIESIEASLSVAKTEIKRLAPFENKYQISQKELDLLKENYSGSMKELEQCSESYKTMQDSYELLKEEKQDCLEKLTICNSEKKQSEKERLEANEKIISLEENYSKVEQEIKRLTPFENKYQTSQKELDLLKENYSGSMKELEECSKRYKTMQDSYDLLLIEKQDCLEKLAICNSEKKQYEKESIESNEKIINLEENYSKAEQEITLKSDEINQLNSKIEELNKDVEFDLRPMPVSGVYTNIVNEIQLADTLNKSNFKLSNIQLKIKTLVNRDKEGVNLQFLNHETAKEVNGNSISEVILDIESAPKEVSESGTLPNLIGFTETAIRRILNNLGLRLNPVYQKNKNVPSGESFKQSPALNSNIQNNQLITVIFSKNE